METASKVSKKVIWLANGLVNIFVLAAILLMLGYGCYAMWDSSQVYSKADAAQYAVYKPTVENKGLSFTELQAINPEVFSWLTVYGTHIDYPVAQGENNLKYINTDAKGKYSLSGCLFLDTDCGKNFSDFSSIIYGHHMDRQTMFGEIGLFKDKSYFDARRYGRLYYNGQEKGLEFFAFVHADAYDNSVFRTKITGQENQQLYLNKLIKAAVYTRSDVSVRKDDRIVLLSTCSASSTNGRDILIGKITDKIYADTFKTVITEETKAIPVIGSLPGIWEQAPLWTKIAIVVLTLLLILSFAVFIYTKKKRNAKRQLRR